VFVITALMSSYMELWCWKGQLNSGFNSRPEVLNCQAKEFGYFTGSMELL
jgi:hypothetical protein